MNNILNAQEAFVALQKGKTVLCRYAGNGNLHADKNFSTLDQMPATVFVLPNYEFCVQVEMLELAGIKFTKPITVDDLDLGIELFVINPAGFIQKLTYQGIGDGVIKEFLWVQSHKTQANKFGTDTRLKLQFAVRAAVLQL